MYWTSMRGIAIVEATELSEFTNYAHILRSVYNHDVAISLVPSWQRYNVFCSPRAQGTQELCKLQESEGNSSERYIVT